MSASQGCTYLHIWTGGLRTFGAQGLHSKGAALRCTTASASWFGEGLPCLVEPVDHSLTKILLSD